MLNNILYRFSDGWDIVTLGQVTPTLYMLSEDRRLWKKLCQYHFAEKQVSVWCSALESGRLVPSRSLVLSDLGGYVFHIQRLDNTRVY